MRILVVGAGGVGTARARIAARRDFFEHLVVADHDEHRAHAAVQSVSDPRFEAAAVDASRAGAVAEVARSHGATHVVNAVDPHEWSMAEYGSQCVRGRDRGRDRVPGYGR